MKGRPVLAACGVAFAFAMALAGCGAGDSGSGASAGDATTPGPDQPDAQDIRSVSVRQTGGIAGIDETSTVRAGSASADDVFALAAALPPPDDKLPQQAPCCDRITYTLTVRYDSEAARYYTWESGPVMDVVGEVLDATG